MENHAPKNVHAMLDSDRLRSPLATFVYNPQMNGTYIQKYRKAYTTDIHHRTEILRSAAAADVQTITAALIAVINSLPSGGERVQLYGRCRMCNQPSMPAWINTRSGIRKGLRLPISGGEPAQQMFARKH